MLQIVRPVLLLDEDRVRQNIRKMIQKANHSRIVFRPHFKTHQSAEIGSWFREYGVKKITVSSVQMACYFAEAGWDDITIAFPVNVLELDLVQRLAATCNINLLVASSETADILARDMKTEIGIFVEVDTGYHRSGIDVDDVASIERILVRFGKNKFLHFKGFLTHTGQTYHARKPENILQITIESNSRLKRLKDYFHAAYPDAIVSIGDTPGCSVQEDFSDVDEIRPGNFVFYDLMQWLHGVCNYNEIAVAMACPVVAVYPERNELIIYGGAVHFSKECITVEDKGNVYGMLVHLKNNVFSEPDADIWIGNLTQEHGIVKTLPHQAAHFSVGDILCFVPVHSCLTASLMREYQTLNGDIIQTMNA